MVRNTAVRQRAYAKTETRRQGNSEGTPARVLASTRDHAPSDESSFLLVFRARDLPALPAVPASLLHGKEGVDGSSPSEGLAEVPANRHLLLSRRKTRTHVGRRQPAPQATACPSSWPMLVSPRSCLCRSWLRSPDGSASLLESRAQSPQLTAFFTSAPILASSAAVNSVSAKEVGHMAPSSRFASSLKPNVAYLDLNFCALWK
jgi:hypothetical protein